MGPEQRDQAVPVELVTGRPCAEGAEDGVRGGGARKRKKREREAIILINWLI